MADNPRGLTGTKVPPTLPIREEIFSFRTRRSTLIHVVADGPWTGGDMERLHDHLRLMLDIDCFEPAATYNQEPSP